VNSQIDEGTLNNLPESLQLAQKAIDTEEVQEIIKQLAKYNLGVCMPHMHTNNNGFVELPKDMIQVERQLVTSFVHSSEVDDKTMIPVVWRYIDGVVVSASSCRMCE
jgi:hypothetical protein